MYTNNQRKANIRKYILDNIGEDYLKECGYTFSTDQEKVKSVYDCMVSEWWNGYEKKRTPDKNEALKQYLMCLPSTLNADFTYYNQRECIKNWTGRTDKEIEQIEDDEISNMFYRFLSYEFFAMLDGEQGTETDTATFKNFKVKANFKGDKASSWNKDNYNNYLVTVTNTDNKQRCTFEFWSSIAKPEINKDYDILNAFYCFVTDAISGDMDFEEFCSEFGYDTDSRTTEKTWKACKRSGEKLKRIYYDDICDLANELQEVVG